MSDPGHAAQILMACLSHDGPGPDARAGLPGADWQAVIVQAARFNLAPLLYYRLRARGLDGCVPPALLQRLRELYYLGAQRDLRIQGWLGKHLRAVQGAGAPVIPLKGAFLAERVYGTAGLRPMVDIDLLIHQEDLARVEERLLGLGYTPVESAGEFAEVPAHRVYRPAGEGVTLELHWNIDRENSPFRVDLDGLWARSRPAILSGIESLALSPEDLLLHLCMHASYHHLFDFGLRPFCDIAETARHYREGLDWGLVSERARQWGAGHCVYLTLQLARSWLAAGVPEEVLRELRPGDFDPRIVAWAEARVFAEPLQVAGPASDHWGRLRASKRPGDKLRAVLDACFPPPRSLADMYALPAGSRRVYLYYPVRVKDLVRRHAGRAWRLLRHDVEAESWIEREARRVEHEAIVWQVARRDRQTLAWIEKDADRARQLAIVKWLGAA